MPMATARPVKVLAQAVATGGAVSAAIANPGAGLNVYITSILIIVTQLAAQAAAGFDVTTTNLEGADVTIPLANSGAAGGVTAFPINFANPVVGKPNAAVSVQGTPTANTRMSIIVMGWVGP